MIAEIFRAAALAVLAVGIVAMSRVVWDLIRHGESKVRSVREDGGGLPQKLKGELNGGQRDTSALRGHGAHFRVTKAGTLAFREKSVAAHSS